MAAHLQQPRRDQLGADLDPLRVGLLLLGQRPCPSRQPALVHDRGLALDPGAQPRRQPTTTSAALWRRPHDLALEQRHGQPVDTGDQLGTMRYPPMWLWSPVLAAGLRFCRDTLAARRSLTTSGPQPEERTGHGPFWGEVFDPASARRTRSSWAAQRARGEAAERRRSRPSTSAQRIPLHRLRYPGDESASGRTHRAHGCITPQPDGDCEGSSQRARTRRPWRTPSPAEATERRDPADQERPQSAARCVGQPGTSRTESLLTTRSRTRSSPAQTKAGRRIRHGCGRRDERGGDAISNRHNRHQGTQHCSSNLGSLRC